MAAKFFSKLQQKSIERRTVSDYVVFDIKRNLGLGADFGDLTALIESSLREGNIKIAIRFTPESYLYTPTLARLVNFYKLIEEQGGTLCLLEPSEEVMQIMDTMGLSKFVEVASSETQIAAT